MIIKVKGKNYRWNYKILLKNLLYLGIGISFIVAYLILAKMDFNTMLGK